jgi:hypothetical protein
MATVKLGARTATGSVIIEMQELKTHAKRIYQILGGDNWFEDSETPKLDLDIEANTKGFVSSQWGLEAEKETVENAQIFDVIDLVTAVSSLGYFRQGLQEFPLEVPENITNTRSEGQTQEPKLTIPYASKFDEWRFRQMDALLGQFPIKIRIEDNDLIKTGDQALEIEFPNLAETIAELAGKALTNEAMVNLLLNINFRLINELGSTKQQGLVSHQIIENIADYLGYENGQIKQKMKLLYNPLYEPPEQGQPDFAQLLKETEIDVIVEQLKEKNSLEEKLDRLLFAASIIRATFFEEVNPNNDDKWDGFVAEYKGIVNAFKNDSGTTEDEFEDFLTKVEDGFTTEPGITDPNNPYGRKRDQRPRIRKIGADNNGTNQPS